MIDFGGLADALVDAMVDAGVDSGADARVELDANADASAVADAVADARADADASADAHEDAHGDGDAHGDAQADGSGMLGPDVVCRVWVGFGDVVEPADRWGACPEVEADRMGALPCASSRGTGRFYSFAAGRAPAAGDALGVALTCTGELAWVQEHCRVTLAQGKASDIAQWNPQACPAGACVDTGGDGRFHPLVLTGPPQGLGIAFSCENNGLPEQVPNVVAAWIAAQQKREGPEGCQDEPLFDDSEVWGACPAVPVDTEGRHRCAASPVDGTFAAFSLEDLVLGGCSGFGVALRRR